MRDFGDEYLFDYLDFFEENTTQESYLAAKIEPRNILRILLNQKK